MAWCCLLKHRVNIGAGNFSTTVSRTALVPTRPPIQWVQGSLSLGLKRPGREADHSPPSSPEVKNAWRYTSIPEYVFMARCLVKHRDNFTLSLQGQYYFTPHRFFCSVDEKIRIIKTEWHIFILASISYPLRKFIFDIPICHSAFPPPTNANQ
jgi:hypothetical protein